MTAFSPRPWLEPHQNGHTVQIYEDDAFLIDGLVRFAGAALAGGDVLLMIATEAHRTAVRERLESNGFDVDAAMAAGRFVGLDASEMLAQFMDYDHPDHARFIQVIGGAIAKAADAATSKQRHVAAYGEMVALLHAAGNAEGALELESLWNELGRSYSFYLHCAYPSTLFAGVGDAKSLSDIVSAHTTTYSPNGSPLSNGIAEEAHALHEQIRRRQGS